MWNAILEMIKKSHLGQFANNDDGMTYLHWTKIGGMVRFRLPEYEGEG